MLAPACVQILEALCIKLIDFFCAQVSQLDLGRDESKRELVVTRSLCDVITINFPNIF